MRQDVVLKCAVVLFDIHSSALTDEKMKVEECIKKGRERYEESRQRAAAAEVRHWGQGLGSFVGFCVSSHVGIMPVRKLGS